MKKVHSISNYPVDTTAMLDVQKNLGPIPDDLFEVQKDSVFCDKYDHVDITSSNMHMINSSTFWNN